MGSAQDLDNTSGGTAPARPRGRRPGGTDTRTQLLDAARVEFAERGYDGATVRVIADRAGVDPAMVNHWFGGKEALFVAALEVPIDPVELAARVVPGPPDQMGERIVRNFLTIWDATGGRPIAAAVRSVAAHESAAKVMRQFVGRMLAAKIVGPVAPDRPELRGALVGSQMIGLGMMRYVLKLEPLASADHATVIAAVAPNVQRYLTGPLD
ncbi:TetR family transcriptional regulator [Pseudonocardia sp.]|uniref:TetR/AcrR family transcriptional regulator n=1 Tax=Pseudonocardia sp. TaxID=60912 RepID=UPI003D0A1C6A